VPIVDLRSARTLGAGRQWNTIAQEIADACSEVGFFIAAGHGVSERLLTEARELAREFFLQPEDQKFAVHLPGRGRGYIPFEAERLGRQGDMSFVGDSKESFNICADLDANVWPSAPSNFRRTMEAVLDEMMSLIDLLMELCGTALALPPGYFREFTAQPKVTLRTTFYPATSSLKEGQVRASEHSDYGTLTVLDPDDDVGGLQVLHSSGRWLDVKNPPGTFVINIGDLMERWTNGRWKSTLHRVVVPADTDFGSRPRISLVFLHNPNPSALIIPVPTCITADWPARYEPIIAGEHLAAKSTKSRQVAKTRQ